MELVFNSIANCSRQNKFESTDTSKILHAIIPELFVMWDKRIKIGVRNEGLLSRHRNSPRDFDGNCYAYEFMPAMHGWAKEFVSTYIEENGGNYDSACDEISKMTDGYTLAKLIDELNYLRFTLRMGIGDIRKDPI